MAEGFLSLQEARAIVLKQGFRSQQEYNAWKERPSFIPANPRKFYGQEWEGWAYWLGTGPENTRKPGTQVDYLPFTEARALAHEVAARLEMKQYTDWARWAKTDEKPANIPADPRHVYLNSGWNGWPDWLGRKSSAANVAKDVRTFLDALTYARSLGLRSSAAWYKWAATETRPLDIPYSPDKRYRDEGWIGWGDFLGFRTDWNRHSIIAFLDSLKPLIETLTEFDLYLILSRNGMLARDSRRRDSKVLRGLIKLKHPKDIDKAKQDIADAMNAESEQNSDNDEVDVDKLPEINASELRPLHVLDDLRTIDAIAEARITDDPEILDFMVVERVAALWGKAFEEDIAAARAYFPDHGGPYLTRIRDTFEAEFQAVENLPIPPDYAFRDGTGTPRAPNLMQKLTAFRLRRDRRLGNWSGVGSGKTVAAILSAGVIDARMTVIVAVNATVRGWRDAILQVFPTGTHVFRGRPRDFHPEPGVRNFLVVNYESFQQEWSEEFVRVIGAVKIDLIVLDEVHFARQRYEVTHSLRRQLLESLIANAIAANSQVRILAMAATPVVNNLREAVKLLELLHPEADFSNVEVGSTIANAVRVHFLLRQYGIRWVPDYEKTIGLKRHYQTPEIDGNRYLSRLVGLKPRDVSLLERTLLDAKLDELQKWVRRGTLIFTYFVEGIVDRLCEKVKSIGLRAEVFTGTEKTDLKEFIERFKAKEADVLIGSAPVGTGVDGLQHHLDRLLFVTLPWSNAEYQQIVGRLYRQGRESGTVEIIIPQVIVREEKAGIWSWDDQRLRLIEYKRTLADAAVDGTIPTGGLPTKEEMQRRSLAALQKWAANVSKGIEPPLPPDTGQMS